MATNGTTSARMRRAVSYAAMYLPATALLPALVLGAAALAGRGPRWLVRRPLTAALLAAGAAGGLARWQLGHLFVEEPDYELERRIGRFEVRRYRPHAVAETVVQAASWEDAINEGFRRLARYIFGANERRQTIPMTTPVGARSTRERIAMTAPVSSRRSPEGYVVTFAMPRARPLESLPVPQDPRVHLVQIPERRVAVLRYHGSYRRRRTEERQAELLARVRAAGLEPTGDPEFAGYDAPSTLPLLRRVEAWLRVG